MSEPVEGSGAEQSAWEGVAHLLYASKMLLGALYRAELARGLERLGYRIEKTHADGRFEIGGVSREVVEAFSIRRAAIEAAMAGREAGTPADNQRVAERAALVTRACPCMRQSAARPLPRHRQAPPRYVPLMF